MAYLMVSLLNDTTCPTLVTTLSWVQALRHHYPFCHHVGRTFWTLELVWTLRPSLHHYRTSIGPQDMIKKLSAKRGKLIHAHESSAKPRKAHISYTFGATGTSETKPKTIKILRNHSKPPKFFACGAMERSKRTKRPDVSPPPLPTPHHPPIQHPRRPLRSVASPGRVQVSQIKRNVGQMHV